jgi:hypothetical protein
MATRLDNRGEKKMHPANLKRKMERDARLDKLASFITRDGVYVNDVAPLMGLRPSTTAKLLTALKGQGRAISKAISVGRGGVAVYYFHPDTSEDEIEMTAARVKMRLMAVVERKKIKQIDVLEIPDLPTPLLAMMGYTKHKPTTGQQFNVDQYSANHPNWNKYQTRKGLERSNVGCSMQMMIESAPGTI